MHSRARVCTHSYMCSVGCGIIMMWCVCSLPLHDSFPSSLSQVKLIGIFGAYTIWGQALTLSNDRTNPQWQDTHELVDACMVNVCSSEEGIVKKTTAQDYWYTTKKFRCFKHPVALSVSKNNTNWNWDNHWMMGGLKQPLYLLQYIQQLVYYHEQWKMTRVTPHINVP